MERLFFINPSIKSVRFIRRCCSVASVELAVRLRTRLPVNTDLWDVATIAQYLKRDPNAMRARICCLPDFPQAIRLPLAQGRGQALYKAAK